MKLSYLQIDKCFSIKPRKEETAFKELRSDVTATRGKDGTIHVSVQTLNDHPSDEVPSAQRNIPKDADHPGRENQHAVQSDRRIASYISQKFRDNHLTG